MENRAAAADVDVIVLPLYEQIKRRIVGRISSGHWAVGSRIPSEKALVEELGVSRMTVHRALRELMYAGVITRVQGVGTFVSAPPRQTSLIELRDIAEEITRRGHRHSATVLELEESEASEAVAMRLELPTGSPVFHCVLLHFDDDQPVQYEDRHVHPVVAPGFLEQDFSVMTPTEYLIRVAPVERIEHTVRAVSAPESLATLLAIGDHAPCLELRRRTWSGGRVASGVTLTYPGSRYQLYSRCATDARGLLKLAGQHD